jgi:hypothetical protein
VKTQLICTFTTKKDVHNTIDEIIERFNVMYDKIFVLSTGKPHEVICSYNIELNPNTEFLPNSILVHRKKDSNTMYSINALNEVIKLHNNGLLDKNFEVDWNTYRNCLLVTSEEGLKRIDTEIFFIQRIKYKNN